MKQIIKFNRCMCFVSVVENTPTNLIEIKKNGNPSNSISKIYGIFLFVVESVVKQIEQTQ